LKVATRIFFSQDHPQTLRAKDQKVQFRAFQVRSTMENEWKKRSPCCQAASKVLIIKPVVDQNQRRPLAPTEFDCTAIAVIPEYR